MKSTELVVQKVRKYIPVAAAAICSAFVASSSYAAITWPPTATDMATAFSDVGENIGLIFAAAITAGLVLYGGTLAVISGIRFFGKFVKQTQAA